MCSCKDPKLWAHSDGRSGLVEDITLNTADYSSHSSIKVFINKFAH